MKEKVMAAVVQFAPEWLQREKNAERMKAFAEQEARNGAELIVFPELANIGYIMPAGPENPTDFGPGSSATDFAVRYVKAAEPVDGPTTSILGDVCRSYGVYIVVGIAELHPVIPATLYDSAVLIGPDGIIGVHHKVHIVMNENRYFYPGNRCEVYSTKLGNIGMMVCYDSRFPELSRVQALNGAEIICAVIAAPCANVDSMAGAELFKYRASVRAHENCVYYLACSRSGEDGDTKFLGHSAIAAPNGRIIACADSEEEVIRAELSNELLMETRVQIAVFRDRRPELYSPIVEPLSQPHRATMVPPATEAKIADASVGQSKQ